MEINGNLAAGQLYATYPTQTGENVLRESGISLEFAIEGSGDGVWIEI